MEINLEYAKKIYMECLNNNNLIIPELKSIEGLFIKIIKASQKEYINNNINWNGIKIFINDLISFFKKIVDDNKTDYINNIIDLFLQMDLNSWDLISYLTIIIYPDEIYNRNRDLYYIQFKNLLSNIYQVKDKIDFNNPIMKSFIKYIEVIDELPLNKQETWNKRVFFEVYSPIIIGYCYYRKIDSSKVNEILRKFIDNYELLRSYFELNGVCDNHFSRINRKIDDIIFVENLAINDIKVVSIK